MKLFASALLSATVYAQSSLYVNNCGSATAVTMFNSGVSTSGATYPSISTFLPSGSSQTITTPELVWTLTACSQRNLDTGVEYIILIHQINTNIYSDDVIMFEVQFTTGSDAGPRSTNGSTMTADSARCTVQLNAVSPTFWSQSSTDGYYYPKAAANSITTSTYATDSS